MVSLSMSSFFSLYFSSLFSLSLFMIAFSSSGHSHVGSIFTNEFEEWKKVSWCCKIYVCHTWNIRSPNPCKTIVIMSFGVFSVFRLLMHKVPENIYEEVHGALIDARNQWVLYYCNIFTTILTALNFLQNLGIKNKTKLSMRLCLLCSTRKFKIQNYFIISSEKLKM